MVLLRHYGAEGELSRERLKSACRRPATVLSPAVGHGKSPWRLNRDQIREIEAIEAAARSSGACGSQSPRYIGNCQACQPARSKLELGACHDRAGTERAWTSADASVGSADLDDLRSRRGLNARLTDRCGHALPVSGPRSTRQLRSRHRATGSRACARFAKLHCVQRAVRCTLLSSHSFGLR